jgi:hypothetical protein
MGQGMRFLGVMGLFLLLSACHHVVLTQKFNPQEAAYVLREGTGRIEGETFWRTRKGRVVKGAGERVYLIPDTAYARDRFAKIFQGKSFVSVSRAPTLESDPVSEKLYAHYARIVTADSRGHFVFDKVAPGAYFIAVVHEFDADMSFKWFDLPVSEGGLVYETVTVMPRGTTKVIVSGKGSLF